jgi:hypothetical protein
VRAQGFEPYWLASHWTVLPPLCYKPNRYLFLFLVQQKEEKIYEKSNTTMQLDEGIPPSHRWFFFFFCENHTQLASGSRVYLWPVADFAKTRIEFPNTETKHIVERKLPFVV